MGRSRLSSKNGPWWRNAGKQTLWVVLIGGLSFGCGMGRGSSYLVILPTLTAAPQEVSCRIGPPGQPTRERRCVVVVKEDWEALVRELKAACLAGGQSAIVCEAE